MTNKEQPLTTQKIQYIHVNHKYSNIVTDVQTPNQAVHITKAQVNNDGHYQTDSESHYDSANEHNNNNEDVHQQRDSYFEQSQSELLLWNHVQVQSTTPIYQDP